MESCTGVLLLAWLLAGPIALAGPNAGGDRLDFGDPGPTAPPVIPSPPTGSCCAHDEVASCTVTTEAACAVPGTWHPEWPTCTPNQCFDGGMVVAWGDDGNGQCEVPSPNRGFVAVAGGWYHSLGLKSDRTIVAWGANWAGQCDVPAPNADFVAVAGGYRHSLGLKSDGTIVAWGDNSSGQCSVPPPNAGFVGVAGGGDHSLGLKSDGTIVAWGANYFGQCDVPLPNAGFVTVARGGDHSLGLRSDSTIAAWGDNYYGQCDVPAANAGFVAVAGGFYHNLGLKSDGTIVAWGANFSGQCNVPAPNTGFVAAAGGGAHSLGLKSDGTISAWGDDDHGQCDIPSPNAGFVAVAAGSLHSLGLKRSPPSVEFTRADVDADGELNISDPIYNLAYQFAGGPPPPCLDAADDDDSGEVNISDPIYSLHCQFTEGPPPPTPFPGCGPDSTPDTIGCDRFPPCDGKARPAPELAEVVDGSKRLWLETVPGTSPDTLHVQVAVVTDVPLAGLEGTAGFDPSRLRFVRCVQSARSPRMDFLAARDLADPPRVRLGGVPDFKLAEVLAPGTYEIGRLVFVRRGSTVSLNGAVWLMEGRFVGRDLRAYRIEGGPSVDSTSPGAPGEEPAAGSVMVFPNPYPPNGPIRLRPGPTAGEGEVAIYDVQGRRVRSLYLGPLPAALNLAWDGRGDGGTDVAAGLYYLMVGAGSHQETRGLLLLK
jgi:hypothetical protein